MIASVGFNIAKKFFNGKKVTLMGLGLLGRGVGDAIFLAKCGARLTITDLKNTESLSPSSKKLKKFKGIKFVLGKHRIGDFKNADVVIKAAGVPLDSPFVEAAKKSDVPVLMSSAIFAKLAKGMTIVGVTGTRGKTTTSHLICEILRASGKRVWLGGNIFGVSTLSLIDRVRPGDFVVLELDSWQLQGFGDLKISPQFSVFTNFYDDHLNYYNRGSVTARRSAYFADKANIFKYQRMGDKLIAGEQVFDRLKKLSVKSSLICARPSKIPVSWRIKLLGKHNRQNIACAATLARALDISDDVIKTAVENFTGVSGRLELTRVWRGISIFNDTTATTPEATIAALRALNFESKNFKKIILICGGADKGLNLKELLAEIPKYVKTAILLQGSGTERLVLDRKLPIIKKNTLAECLAEAIKIAESGDVILFSPAFASFGLFKNEYDRGDQFMKLVKKLPKY
jgi:UDP-N-acetylmuramoylalanine--D-glutamate ligase